MFIPMQNLLLLISLTSASDALVSMTLSLYILYLAVKKTVCCKVCFVGLRFTDVENNRKSSQLMFQQKLKTFFFFAKIIKTKNSCLDS
jgi:hypothetical protein